MRPNELRIGSRIKCYGENSEITLIGTEVVSAKYDGENGKISVIFSNPTLQSIPLTEEWLLNFGFKKSSEGFFSIKTNKRSINLEINLKTKRTILFNNLNKSYVDLMASKYVHQLQNLYFSLTEKELTLNTNQ